MTKRIFISITSAVLISSILILYSCKKEAGTGGQASIRGKVYSNYYNKTFTTLIGAGYAPERDIYIIYGDNYSYNDRTRTNYDGSYEFKYLRKGMYKIYVYSSDSTGAFPSGMVEVSASTEITKNNQVITLPDLVICNN
jgi:hypothetical protein